MKSLKSILKQLFALLSEKNFLTLQYHKSYYAMRSLVWFVDSFSLEDSSLEHFTYVKMKDVKRTYLRKEVYLKKFAWVRIWMGLKSIKLKFWRIERENLITGPLFATK